jgi:hypothetical protein
MGLFGKGGLFNKINPLRGFRETGERIVTYGLIVGGLVVGAIVISMLNNPGSVERIAGTAMAVRRGGR